MIRKLCEDDIPFVLHLMRELRIESPVFRHYPADEAWVTQNLLAMMQAPTTIMLIDDKQRGVMFGYTGSPWWSPYYEANEMLLAVSTEYRGSPVAVRLIKEFERIATERNCRSVNVGSSLGINDERVVGLYSRLGYVSRGHGLTKRIDDV